MMIDAGGGVQLLQDTSDAGACQGSKPQLRGPRGELRLEDDAAQRENGVGHTAGGGLPTERKEDLGLL